MEKPTEELVTAIRIGIDATLDDHDNGMNIANDYFCDYLSEYYCDYKNEFYCDYNWIFSNCFLWLH